MPPATSLALDAASKSEAGTGRPHFLVPQVAKHGVISRATQSVQSCPREESSPFSSLWKNLTAAAMAAAFTLSATPPALATMPYTLSTSLPSMTTPDVMERLAPLPSDFPPLPQVKLPKYARSTLPNGLRVILLEDHEAPLVRGVVLMRGGQRASPADKIGLATVSAAVQRSGGSQAHPGAELEEELEELSASIEGGAGAEATSLGFSCLAEDAPRVLSLFSEVLTTPTLAIDKIELYKTQALNSLAHRNDNPSAIPGREAAKLIYGKDSIYAREPTIEQVSGMTVEDVRTWLDEWERPDAAVLGIVGDFNTKDMTKLVKEALGGWSARVPGPPPPLPSSPLPDQTGVQGRVFLIDRPGSTQASVAQVEPGIQMMDPDECALDVLGDLLNSFGGRLFDDIRSREGLAYSVNAGWSSAPPDHRGLFIASAETAKPAELLGALRAALNTAATTAPTAEEVNRAKEESMNSFVFGFSSAPVQLRRAVTFELLGIPQDYVFKYQARLGKVTPADVQGAAERHLHPERQVTVVIGDAAKLRPGLEATLGKVVELLVVD